MNVKLQVWCALFAVRDLRVRDDYVENQVSRFTAQDETTETTTVRQRKNEHKQVRTTHSPSHVPTRNQKLTATLWRHTYEYSVILMGRHTLFQTVVQGYRVTEKYAQREGPPA